MPSGKRRILPSLQFLLSTIKYPELNMQSKPTFAIGDVQGCNAQLLALLARIHAVSTNTRLIFVGDLVNRGPQSLATLRHVRRLGARAAGRRGGRGGRRRAAARG